MIPLLQAPPNRPRAAGRWSRKVGIEPGFGGVGGREHDFMRRVGQQDPRGKIASACRRGAGRRRSLASGMALALVASALVSGWVGAHFGPSPAPDVDGYLPGKLASPRGAGSGPRVAGQRFISGADVS